jgi:CRP-like cAMP-binding protein
MQESFCLQQLKSCDLFRELSEKELLILYASMVEVHIKEGETLCSQGEISDSMYILLSGRLLVKTVDGKVVGQISRGQTVGEMGLITHEPRSATVKAMRDCLLLKLDNVHFDQVWEKYPSVLFEVTKTITQRLQRTLKSGQNNPRDSILLFSQDSATLI